MTAPSSREQERTGRAVAEWVGDHPDQAIPKRVKLRIWAREGGRCYLTGRKIRPGDSYEFEHVIPLAIGGSHRETNIRLALTAPHKIKSADDAKVKAHVDRMQAKHLGMWKPPGRRLKGRPFPKYIGPA